jgi:hypothetical protein
LVRRGHNLQALLHEYPIDLVLNLQRAALRNRQLELEGRVLGLSVAVMNALDMAFNGGKGRILETWLKALDAHGAKGCNGCPKRRVGLSPGARTFFGGRPVVVKTDKD